MLNELNISLSAAVSIFLLLASTYLAQAAIARTKRLNFRTKSRLGQDNSIEITSRWPKLKLLLLLLFKIIASISLIVIACTITYNIFNWFQSLKVHATMSCSIVLLITILAIFFYKYRSCYLSDNSFISMLCCKLSLCSLSSQLRMFGKAKFQYRVYVDDTRVISIELTDVDRDNDITVPSFASSFDNTGADINFSIRRDISDQDNIEFELLAGCCKFDGSPTQSQSLMSAFPLSFQWSCHFPYSGDHEIVLVCHHVSGINKICLGKINISIRVVKLFNMTQRQIWLLASILALVSGGVATAKAVHDIFYPQASLTTIGSKHQADKIKRQTIYSSAK